MATPDFVVVGHAVRDLVPGGWRWGGTATFAACQAQQLGLRAGIVTRVARDAVLETVLPEAAIAGRPTMATTTFENIEQRGRRRQRVPAQAEPLAEEDLPPAWHAAPIVLIGPVCGEAPANLSGAFPRSLVGISAQGWLRRLDRQRRVRRRAWTQTRAAGPPFWSGCRALFVSDEDLGRRRDQLARWTEEVPIVVQTQHQRGARLHLEGSWRRIGAFPAREVDPTGAGDVFAAAFLVRYHETNDPAGAARFASAAAACSVEAPGIEGIATRRQIEGRMEEHPEIVLR